MAKLRVLLPFKGLIMKKYSNSFFRSYFPLLGLKLAIFGVFFPFWPLFSLRGRFKKFFSRQCFFNSFHIHKWFQKKLFENIIFFSWIFIPILGKSKNRFISLSYCFLQKPEICPKYMVVELSLGGRSYQNPFGSWPFGSYRRQIKTN